MVFETLVCSPLNHLTRLIARENFIILSHRESNKSRITVIIQMPYLSKFIINSIKLLFWIRNLLLNILFHYFSNIKGNSISDQ